MVHNASSDDRHFPARKAQWTLSVFRSALGAAVLAATCLGAAWNGRAVVSRLPDQRPFVVESYLFDANGGFVGSASNSDTRITGLIYGERVQNTLLYPPPGERDPIASADWGATAGPAPPPQGRFALDHWTQKDGLPANKVRALCQTSDGYLWVGTVAGLARFDGTTFTVYDETNSPAMAANGSVVRALVEDSQGRLWLGTRRGLLCRDANRFVPFPGQEKWQGQMINGLARRSAGGVWVAHNGGVSYQDSDGVHDLSVPGIERPLCVGEGASNTLWIGAVNGLFEFDLQAGRVVRMALEGQVQVQTVEDYRVYDLRIDRLGRLWAGCRLGAVLCEPGTRPQLMALWKMAGMQVPCDARFTEDRSGRIWATTQKLGGVVVYPQGPASPEWVQTPAIDNAICILADRDGAIWVGTHEGLVRLCEKPLTPVRLEGINMFGGPMQAIAEAPDGTLFFVAGQFVGSWRGKAIRVADLALMVGRPFLPGAIACFAERVWAGHPRGGLFAIPDFQHPLPHLTSIRAVHPEIGRVRTLHAGRSGFLWIASERGLFRRSADDRLREMTAGSRAEIHALLEDASGVLFIAGAGGVARLENGKMKSLAGASSTPLRALSLAQDASGDLWVGTDSGLRLWRGGRWHEFDSSSGLPQDAIQSIVHDRFQRLWLNHQSGIARVAVSELKAWLHKTNEIPAVAGLAAADGVSESGGGECSAGGLVGRDGRLWFARGDELAVVDPAHCPPGRPAPSPIIQDVVLNGKGQLADPTVSSSQGSLKSLVFQFTALGLRPPERGLIQFRLDGLDPAWRNAGSWRRAIYSDVPPGQYCFRVRARNDEGQWSEQEAVVQLQVRPMFWQTTRAQLAGGLLLVTALIGMAGSVVALRRRSHQERERALRDHRERLARNLHDHLAPRLSEIALAERLEEAAQTAAEISAKELREMIWEVHPENDTLPRLFDFFADFAQRHLCAAGVRLELDLPSLPPAIALAYATRQEASGLFKEAARNVVRHSGATHAVVSARCDGKQLQFSISDNGRGFDPDAQLRPSPTSSSRYGLRNFQTRCRELGGRCEIRTAPGQGARVTFTLPLA